MITGHEMRENEIQKKLILWHNDYYLLIYTIYIIVTHIVYYLLKMITVVGIYYRSRYKKKYIF